MTKQNKSWEEFYADTRELAFIIGNSFEPTMIVAVARGGFVPARLLSNFLNVRKLSAIGLAYSSEERSGLALYSKPTLLVRERILLVEDCLESGKSLKIAKDALRQESDSILTCSVYALHSTLYPADFVYRILETTPLFPWDIESLS